MESLATGCQITPEPKIDHVVQHCAFPLWAEHFWNVFQSATGKKKKKEKSLESATDGDTDVQIFLVSA